MNELIMLVGIPGSGKTSWAYKTINKIENCVIHSSDNLRKELYGDENDQEHNSELFNELHNRIRQSLKEGKTVIYDATNLNKKRRIKFLNTLGPVRKICVLFLTDLSECLKRNRERGKNIPDEVIYNMYKTFCPPYYHEGFDEIQIKQYSWKNPYMLINMTKGFDQENEHHKLDLKSHLWECYKYLSEENEKLQIAGMFHDIGKLFTKTYVNIKGVADGNCHYYNHQNVSAYEFLQCLIDYNVQEELKDDALYTANLIYFHMHPYLSWTQSEKAKERDRLRIGEEMFNDIMKLHEADVKAHG